MAGRVAPGCRAGHLLLPDVLRRPDRAHRRHRPVRPCCRTRTTTRRPRTSGSSSTRCSCRGSPSRWRRRPSTSRLTRTQMVETLGEDYIRTARAKGLPERVVTVKHALRAGLTPIVTAAGLDLGLLLGGAIITEQIFNLPGLGPPRGRCRGRLGPARDHRRHARGGRVHHRRELHRRPALHGHRPEGEALVTAQSTVPATTGTRRTRRSSSWTTSRSASRPRTASSAPSTGSPSPSSAGGRWPSSASPARASR